MAIATDTSSRINDTGMQLMRRAPTGYLWNQAGAVWLFVSLLLFEVVVRRSLPKSETNVFDLVSTAANLGFYLASLGLTSAGTVYLPRALTEGGAGQARALANRLVAMRLLLALLVGAIALWGLPALVTVVDASKWPTGIQITRSFTAEAIIQHRTMIAAYVIAVGMSTLLSSLLIALVHTRVVFIFGSLGQLLLLVLGYILIHTMGSAVDGALAAEALSAALTAVIFAIVLRRLLGSPRTETKGQTFWRPAMRLGVAAWLADLPNSSLVQPLALGQLAAVAPGELPVLQEHLPNGRCRRALLYRWSGRREPGHYVDLVRRQTSAVTGNRLAYGQQTSDTPCDTTGGVRNPPRRNHHDGPVWPAVCPVRILARGLSLS